MDFDFSAYADEAERATYDPADDKLRILAMAGGNNEKN